MKGTEALLRVGASQNCISCGLEGGGWWGLLFLLMVALCQFGCLCASVQGLGAAVGSATDLASAVELQLSRTVQGK